ncbi:hypothetical protein [Paracidovorax wautersii]|uniref:hypothetical protein n=1 Tax=Paracidovorax wautersii TaxID=1177982 RepID=UPI0015872C72|nr:hypothetical protein [Paracidovorax wautersii]
MNGNGYSKSKLWLVRDDPSPTRRVVLCIEPGGRLDQALLFSGEVQAAVKTMWGDDIAAALCVDATLVLGRTSPAEAV